MGTILSGDSINIDRVSSGRNPEDKTAMNIFNVEGDWHRGLKENLEAVQHVVRVWMLDLDG